MSETASRSPLPTKKALKAISVLLDELERAEARLSDAEDHLGLPRSKPGDVWSWRVQRLHEGLEQALFEKVVLKTKSHQSTRRNRK